MSGILTRFPDLTIVRSGISDCMSGISSVTGTINDTGGPSSPVSGVISAVSGIETHLSIDISGITTKLPQTIEIIKNAIPAGTIEFVQSIQNSYTQAFEFINNSGLAKQVQNSTSIETVALSAVEEILSHFGSRLTELGNGMIDPSQLDQLRQFIQTIESMAGDFEGNAADFLPFLSQNLIGIRHDLFGEVAGLVESGFATLNSLQPAALQSTLFPARNSINLTVENIVTAIRELNPSDSTTYSALRTALETIETEINSICSAGLDFYTQLESAIDAYSWDSLFTGYIEMLDAVSLEDIPSIDDVLEQLNAVLQNLITRIAGFIGADEIVGRIESLSVLIRDTFVNSPIGQARQELTGFLDSIRETIESVPTETIKSAVEGMISRVGDEINNLGIDSIRTTIEQAFGNLTKYINDTLKDSLVVDATDAVNNLLAGVQDLPIDELVSSVNSAIESIGALIEEIEAAISGKLDDFQNLISQLDQVSFKPVGDEVVVEITDLKGKLQAINPNSLSDIEKLAIKGALALIREIDLTGKITVDLKGGFGIIVNEIKELLAVLTAALENLRKNMGEYDPSKILEPVNSLFDSLSKGMNSLNAAALLSPIYKKIDEFVAILKGLSPGSLLSPLQKPYDDMMQYVEMIDPAKWTAPLNELYNQIDLLIDKIDITPLLDKLDEKRRELLSNAQNALIENIDSLDLPSPLDGFFEQIKLTLNTLTDAIFGSTDTELKTLGLSINTDYSLSTLFKPLDSVFDRLLELINNVPRETLVSAMEQIRTGVGTVLTVLDPRTIIGNFQAALGQLVSLSPPNLLGGAIRVAGLKGSFLIQVESAPESDLGAINEIVQIFDRISVKLDISTEMSSMGALIDAHNRVVDLLREKINQLDTSGATESFARVQRSLNRLVPAFLCSNTSLTYEDISMGLATLRPSNKARKLDRAMELFLSKLKPLEEALQPAVDGFFVGIRDTVKLLDPLSIKEDIRSIYDTIREKIRILNPQELTGSLREQIYLPIIDPLNALNPSGLASQIDGVFNEAMDALISKVKPVLDAVSTAIDNVLSQIRDAVKGFIQTIKATIESALSGFGAIIDKLDNLVFIEIIGRLSRLLDNIGVSFDRELDRVKNEFDAMLNAIPLGGSASVQVSA